ncbi:tRNA (adenosine(37)-N6)-threonylcarbamoyltransferase complex dimerization subunit type 1 TsaB [uncultured Sulfitobacter sp.]|uniref:tRNA (adenosine(37)-N6)-threonylcarbamoyltransferase complex dimerization subunit type 1 TsaB n=1 Tax=uncultured Sulfitobacter sp. TaxID=191468 RepID=UPI002622FE65|nr:tRNA (adenosine(37)-N6)-threonylcarbamoyltransferase complex dimerization subunit type 1 TsaB [uncultured Sulfitobacter sp.]
MFDTSGPFVAVGGGTNGSFGGRVLDMAKGQAETLFPTIEGFLKDSGWTLADIDVIGVATGPGNFTGIRISVSAARGLGLALGIPVFGITQFELAYGHLPVPHGTLVSVPAPRGLAYVQGFGTGVIIDQPQIIDPAHPPRNLQLPFGMEIRGHRASEIAAHFNAAGYDDAYKPDPARMADIAQTKYLEAAAFPPPPAPNYVKPPDAAPARDTPPRIVA